VNSWIKIGLCKMIVGTLLFILFPFRIKNLGLSGFRMDQMRIILTVFFIAQTIALSTPFEGYEGLTIPIQSLVI
tara:strand:- start:16369 stop:16590 length:222 start_codon:yes stop_codon:yes gene_type:complete